MAKMAVVAGSATQTNGAAFNLASTQVVSTVVPAHTGVRIATTGLINIRFTSDGSSVASNLDMFLAAGAAERFDTGVNTRVNIFGNGAGSVAVTFLQADSDEL